MASSIIPKALNGDISSLNDALAHHDRIGLALSGNSSTTINIDYTVGHRILFISHSSNTSLRGIYLLRGASAPLCMVESTGVTITDRTATSITLTNSTGNTAGIDIL